MRYFVDPRSTRSKILSDDLRLRIDQLNTFRYPRTLPTYANATSLQKCLERFLVEAETLREVLQMPPKKKLSNDWKGFVNYKLSEDERANFLNWDVHDDDVWLFVSQANTEGYRFSTSYNKGNNTFNALLSCNDATSPNNGYSLSGYAPTWYEAIRVVLFKHIVVFDYHWSTDGAEGNGNKWG